SGPRTAAVSGPRTRRRPRCATTRSPRRLVNLSRSCLDPANFRDAPPNSAPQPPLSARVPKMTNMVLSASKRTARPCTGHCALPDRADGPLAWLDFVSKIWVGGGDMINAAFVRGCKPRAKMYEVTCEALPGFILRVLPTGKKVVLVRYRVDGKDRRIK